MNSYPRRLELAEFIMTFRDRYVYKDANGLTVIAMTSSEALQLSKYLFRGIAESAEDGPAGTGGPLDLGESLERFADLNIRETNLELLATDEDLRSLGSFLMRGLAAVFLNLEVAHERAYSC